MTVSPESNRSHSTWQKGKFCDGQNYQAELEIGMCSSFSLFGKGMCVCQ